MRNFISTPSLEISGFTPAYTWNLLPPIGSKTVPETLGAGGRQMILTDNHNDRLNAMRPNDELCRP